MLTEGIITELACRVESFNVDFKRNISSKVRDIAEKICCFANSAGGYVISGEDNGNRIVGIEMSR